MVKVNAIMHAEITIFKKKNASFIDKNLVIWTPRGGWEYKRERSMPDL